MKPHPLIPATCPALPTAWRTLLLPERRNSRVKCTHFHLLGLLPPTPRSERGCHLPGLEKMVMCTGAARRVWGDYPLNEWCVSEGDSLGFIESHPSKQLLATLPLWLSLAWAFREPLTKSFQSPSPHVGPLQSTCSLVLPLPRDSPDCVFSINLSSNKKNHLFFLPRGQPVFNFLCHSKISCKGENKF